MAQLIGKGRIALANDAVTAGLVSLSGSKTQQSVDSRVEGAATTAAATYLAGAPAVTAAAVASVGAALTGAGVLYGVSDMDPTLTGHKFAAIDEEGKILFADGGTSSGGGVSWTGTHVIPVLGQSNNTTIGEPIAQRLNEIDPNVFQIPQSGGLLNTIVPAVEPLVFPRPAAQVGASAAVWFAKKYAAAHPGVRVIIVPLAKGGVPFRGDSISAGYTWAVDRHDVTNLFDEAVTRTNAAVTLAAGHGPVSIGAVLWFHGESDSANSTTGAQYATDIDALIAAYRAQVTLAASAPFLIHQMVREFMEVRHLGTVDDINAALINTPARMPLTAFAYSDPLGYALADNTHLNYTGQMLAADAYWKAYTRALLNVTTQPVSPPTNVVLQQIGANVSATWDQPRAYHTSIELDFSKNDGTTWTAVTHTVQMAAYDTIVAPGAGKLQVRVRAAIGATKSAYAYAYLNVV